tara:strand:+ start:28533 stop:28868 length:336 start_codon:yes stop_codon:yes gene_type:complete
LSFAIGHCSLFKFVLDHKKNPQGPPLTFASPTFTPHHNGTPILTMNTNDQLKTLETAILHGGGFYSKLAHAALSADPDNRALIFKTWPRLETMFGPLGPFHRSTPELRLIK